MNGFIMDVDFLSYVTLFFVCEKISFERNDVAGC
jgi:hypothetical protein